MIVVTLEMYPLGLERAKYRLGNIVITNDGSGDNEIGAYDVIMETLERDGTLSDVKKCRVEDFARANGVFSLLSHALDCVRPGPWYPIARAPSETWVFVCRAGEDDFETAIKRGGVWFDGFGGAKIERQERLTHFMYRPKVPKE